jgi:hypothetical protein
MMNDDDWINGKVIQRYWGRAGCFAWSGGRTPVCRMGREIYHFKMLVGLVHKDGAIF